MPLCTTEQCNELLAVQKDSTYGPSPVKQQIINNKYMNYC